VSPFSAIFVPDGLADVLSDRAWLEALLDADAPPRRLVSRVSCRRRGGGRGRVAGRALRCEALAREDALPAILSSRSCGDPRGSVRSTPVSSIGATSQDILDTGRCSSRDGRCG
jgi:hypothetical protein